MQWKKTKKTEQHFHSKSKNKQVHWQIKIHYERLKNVTKIEKDKKEKKKNTKKIWSTKYQRINTQPIKTKTIKYTRRLRYITSTWITLIKLANTKNWTWRNTKQTWTLLKLTNTKKLNSNSMAEHKTDINITKCKKLIMTEHKKDINITKIEKYKKITWRNTKQTWTLLKLTNTKKNEQHFYRRIQN